MKEIPNTKLQQIIFVKNYFLTDALNVFCLWMWECEWGWIVCLFDSVCVCVVADVNDVCKYKFYSYIKVYTDCHLYVYVYTSHVVILTDIQIYFTDIQIYRYISQIYRYTDIFPR